MLLSTFDLVADVTSDSLKVFFVCNLIILVIFAISLKNEQCEQKHNAYQPFNYSQKSHVVIGNLSNGEVSISVEDSPQEAEIESLRVQVMLRLAEEKSESVQHYSTCDQIMRNAEIPEGSSEQYTILETPQGGRQIQADESDELVLVGIGGMSFHINCNENNNDEICEHVEEDDQFRKRVEAFISKVNDGRRAEIMLTATVR